MHSKLRWKNVLKQLMYTYIPNAYFQNIRVQWS